MSRLALDTERVVKMYTRLRPVHVQVRSSRGVGYSGYRQKKNPSNFLNVPVPLTFKICEKAVPYGRGGKVRVARKTCITRLDKNRYALQLYGRTILLFKRDGSVTYTHGSWKSYLTRCRMAHYGPLVLYSDRYRWFFRLFFNQAFRERAWGGDGDWAWPPGSIGKFRYEEGMVVARCGYPKDLKKFTKVGQWGGRWRRLRCEA